MGGCTCILDDGYFVYCVGIGVAAGGSVDGSSVGHISRNTTLSFHAVQMLIYLSRLRLKAPYP